MVLVHFPRWSERPTRGKRINKFCTQFEESWKQATLVAIKDVVEELEARTTKQALMELLLLNLFDRTLPELEQAEDADGRHFNSDWRVVATAIRNSPASQPDATRQGDKATKQTLSEFITQAEESFAGRIRNEHHSKNI